MKIDHFNIKAPPELLQQVRDFYCQVLGLEQGARPPFDSQGYWLYAGSHPVLHLSETDTEHPEGTGYLDHVAFGVDDPQPIIDALEAQCVPYRTYRVPGKETMQVFFSDPAGIKVEVDYPAREGDSD